MLISAAVCPHPPIVVPELAGAAAPELDGLRAACDRAVATLPGVRTGAGGGAQDEDSGAVLIVVGGGARTRTHPGDTAGTLRPYGLDLVIGSGEPVLPLSLTIGRWLLARAGRRPAVLAEIGSDATPAECLRFGTELAGSAERVAMLVMGDGSACLSAAAPGYLDERAGPYDSAVAAALEQADPSVPATLDPGLSDALQVAGRAAWQVLAGAATAATATPTATAERSTAERSTAVADDEGGSFTGGFTGALLYSEAPYGVGYHVATWTRQPSSP